MIKIITPKHKDVVSQNVKVEGKSKHKVPLQVYVLANDHKWYLQPEVVHVGKKWSCDCVLGDKDTPDGARFIVVGIKTSKRPHTPLDNLPIGERSNAIILQIKK